MSQKNDLSLKAVRPVSTGGRTEPVEGLREALRKLADKLHTIDADQSMSAVFSSAWIHGVKYTGPSWKDELATADELLNLKQMPDEQANHVPSGHSSWSEAKTEALNVAEAQIERLRANLKSAQEALDAVCRYRKDHCNDDDRCEFCIAFDTALSLPAIHREPKGERVVLLEEALFRLANEASGFRSMADPFTHGHTNMAVLGLRIDEARALLGPKQTPPEAPEEGK